MSASPPLRVLFGAADAVGAHVVHALLSRPGSAFVVDPDLPSARLAHDVEAALREVAWAHCEPPDASLLENLTWVDTWDGLRSLAARTQAQPVQGPREWWHLESGDPGDDPRDHDPVSRLRSALRAAAELACVRFVYLSSLDASLVAAPASPDLLRAPAGESEREVASFCEAAGIAFTILRASAVAGPFATLRTTRPGPGLTRFLARLRSFLTAAATSGEPTSDRASANLIPADRLAADVLRIVDDGFAGGPVHVLASGEDVTVRLVPGAAKEPAEQLENEALLELPAGGARLGVSVRKTALPRTLPAHPPISLETALALVEALIGELNGYAVRQVFTSGVGTGAHGTPLVTYECGAESATPVVLVNAYGMPAELLAPLSARLAPSFRVLTWESGRASDACVSLDTQRLAPKDHAADLASLLRQRGIRRTDVVSWCNGAQVALAFAEAFPDLLRHIVFVGGTFELDPPLPPTEYARMIVALARNASRSRRQANMLSEVMRRQEGVVSEQDRANIASARLRHLCKLPYRTGEALFRYALGVKEFADARVARITFAPDTRVLLVTGGRDATINPGDRHWMEGQIARARWVGIPNATHVGIHDDAETVNAVVEFLAEMG
jgi:pimeloyl-ACP methyl ester carboxylesterase